MSQLGSEWLGQFMSDKALLGPRIREAFVFPRCILRDSANRCVQTNLAVCSIYKQHNVDRADSNLEYVCVLVGQTIILRLWTHIGQTRSWKHPLRFRRGFELLQGPSDWYLIPLLTR